MSRVEAEAEASDKAFEAGLGRPSASGRSWRPGTASAHASIAARHWLAVVASADTAPSVD